VTKGDFGNNRYAGLSVYANGAVTLDEVRASDNGKDGVGIENNEYSIQPVTVKRTSVNGNSYNGLQVNSKGLITLDKVTATYNGDYGAYLSNDNDGAAGGSPSTARWVRTSLRIMERWDCGRIPDWASPAARSPRAGTGLWCLPV